ncbi:hypothetical protein ACHQM5_028667 [Ranunculus cassubicifolius]
MIKIFTIPIPAFLVAKVGEEIKQSERASKTWKAYRKYRVAKEVAKIVALALGLDDFFDKPEMLEEAIATLRLLHYEGTVSDTEKGIYGAGAHSDFGLITLLATDDVWGLQICKDKDANPQVWEYVPPQKGALIINLGDMLEGWSNGIFRSAVHRVLGFLKRDTRFFPVKCSTYLRQRYKDTHTDLSSYQNRKT